LIRLIVPFCGIVAFFFLSLVTVRLLRPKQPKSYFVSYAMLLLIISGWAYVSIWGLATLEDGIALTACLLVQALLCLTMWNSFYSLLWGFSGGLMYDLLNDPSVRQVECLIRSYDPEGGVDRILARRLPNLARGGYIDLRGDVMSLRPKGRLIAFGTWCSFKIFSLGMGGGIKEQ
jgi:hypothetical protein